VLAKLERLERDQRALLKRNRERGAIVCYECGQRAARRAGQTEFRGRRKQAYCCTACHRHFTLDPVRFCGRMAWPAKTPPWNAYGLRPDIFRVYLRDRRPFRTEISRRARVAPKCGAQ
jgi:hypothetical protein